MTAAKSYFQDRLVLLLLSVNSFLTLLSTILILFRIGGTSEFIVQYRSNLGVSRFKAGSVASILAFIVYAFVVFAANTALSWRSYHVRRQLSLTILLLGTILLLLCVIVSNALLALR
jgi:hypothetical protein